VAASRGRSRASARDGDCTRDCDRAAPQQRRGRDVAVLSVRAREAAGGAGADASGRRRPRRQ
jgi:hypothetical protein